MGEGKYEPVGVSEVSIKEETMILSAVVALVLAPALRGSYDVEEIRRITESAHARVGVCLISREGEISLRGDERFSLQSVVKLIVGAVALDDVDKGRWKLTDKVSISKKDRSVSVQPLADLVVNGPAEVTVGELIRLAVIESDSMANDVLFKKIGGAEAVSAFLRIRGITGMRVDRSEKELQTEIAGLRWHSAFTDEQTYEDALNSVSDRDRDAAYKAYQKDPRDTASPRAMAYLLPWLQTCGGWSKESTSFLLQAMADCQTGANRLTAGLKPGWKLGHKTGTSGSHRGVSAATNDVGIFTSPKGETVVIAVFVGDSTDGDDERAKVIADLGAYVCGG